MPQYITEKIRGIFKLCYPSTIHATNAHFTQANGTMDKATIISRPVLRPMLKGALWTTRISLMDRNIKMKIIMKFPNFCKDLLYEIP
jgi:hypothetical protein